jgi:hypothetical protein
MAENKGANGNGNGNRGADQPPAGDQQQADAERRASAERAQEAAIVQGGDPQGRPTGLPPGGISTGPVTQYPRGGTYAEPQPPWPDVPQEVTEEMRQQWAEDALAREVRSARTRGVAVEELSDDEYRQNLGWIVSNRWDDRGYQEFDPRHPGGEMAIGGSAPDYVYLKSPMVTELLRQNLIKVVPEPQQYIEQPDPATGQPRTVLNPLFPPPKGPARGSVNATQPGREIELGRDLHPGLWTTDQRREDRRVQARLADHIPVPRELIQPTPTAELERQQREAAAARRQGQEPL